MACKLADVCQRFIAHEEKAIPFFYKDIGRLAFTGLPNDGKVCYSVCLRSDNDFILFN